uniref:Neurotransmitter-gated ion-channel transmembrane domain-containing protein n=1 Tax=Amphilophus citrinellus TaxID=61819 RepID=A0A3Q0S279_AMPCI
MYVVNLLIPSCFLITVDLFSFLLPPQSVDRSNFKMTLILGYTVFLLIMNDLLPATGNTIPLINVFFSICLTLMVASLLETILVTSLLCGSADFPPVPRWIRVLVLQLLGFLVCMPPLKKKPRASGMLLLSSFAVFKYKLHEERQDYRNNRDWVQVGFIIDRLLFGLYILFITVSFITIIIIWVNSYNRS